MARIVFRKGEGADHEVEADIGGSVMQVAKAAGVDGIEAECGGSMVCGTCHVYVEESWYAQLPAASAMEAEMLEYVIAPRPCSRLSCQLTVDAAMDGIRIEIPPSQR